MWCRALQEHALVAKLASISQRVWSLLIMSVPFDKHCSGSASHEHTHSDKKRLFAMSIFFTNPTLALENKMSQMPAAVILFE